MATFEPKTRFINTINTGKKIRSTDLSDVIYSGHNFYEIYNAHPQRNLLTEMSGYVPVLFINPIPLHKLISENS